MILPVSKLLQDIEEEVELEGNEPGTPKFKLLVLDRQVRKCQELQRVSLCTDCPAFLGCTLAARHLMEIKYGEKNGNNENENE